jgi:hypothetical protein
MICGLSTQKSVGPRTRSSQATHGLICALQRLSGNTGLNITSQAIRNGNIDAAAMIMILRCLIFMMRLMRRFVTLRIDIGAQPSGWAATYGVRHLKWTHLKPVRSLPSLILVTFQHSLLFPNKKNCSPFNQPGIRIQSAGTAFVVR